MTAPLSQTLHVIRDPGEDGETHLAEEDMRTAIRKGRDLANKLGHKLEYVRVEQMVYVVSPILPED